MSARVDASLVSTVVWCTECPSWSRVALSPSNGHDIAVDHENAVHPESRSAEINRFKYRRKNLASGLQHAQ